ncbi:SDR family NAD(P)-dependent oxidoreductase, partial [Hyphobacterium sp.]
MASDALKTAIVTGSNSGIGLGIARALAAEGHNVVLNSYTDTDDDHALAREIAASAGNETVYIQADLSKADQSRMLVDKAAERFGSVDILVNNAGIQHVAPVEEFPTEKWDAIIAINLSSAFHTAAATIPMMKNKGWGRIVNIASAHGLTASPYKSAYIAA